MAMPRAVPALADLTQEIAGPIPVELLHNWAAGAQDLGAARAALEAFRIEGTVVATDTSGLSHMTRAQDLLDVLLLVSRPMEVVHGLGTAAGGRAVGVWVADNSEMFYPETVDPARVVEAVHETRARIDAALPVRVGFCVHRGRYYEIGGGLYGEDARIVEGLAEDHAGPGEVLVTGSVAAALAGCRDFRFARRSDLDVIHPSGVFALASARRRVYDTYQRERAVLFVAREQLRETSSDLTLLLDDLLLNALTDTIVLETVGSPGPVSSSGGGLAILTFAAVGEALECALELRARFARNGLLVRAGIDSGSLLLFPRAVGGRCGLAGDPVNTASKLAEDLGIAGRIHVTSRAAAAVASLPEAEPFATVLSGVPIRGVIV